MLLAMYDRRFWSCNKSFRTAYQFLGSVLGLIVDAYHGTRARTRVRVCIIYLSECEYHGFRHWMDGVTSGSGFHVHLQHFKIYLIGIYPHHFETESIVPFRYCLYREFSTPVRFLHLRFSCIFLLLMNLLFQFLLWLSRIYVMVGLRWHCRIQPAFFVVVVVVASLVLMFEAPSLLFFFECLWFS